MTRFVVDCDTLLRIAAGEIDVAAGHQLVAPTLIRSQALAALYQAARRGEISTVEGRDRVKRINALEVRFLGDKVLQAQAWKVAAQLERITVRAGQMGGVPCIRDVPDSARHRREAVPFLEPGLRESSGKTPQEVRRGATSCDAFGWGAARCGRRAEPASLALARI